MILQYDLREGTEVTPDNFYTNMIELKHKKIVSLADYQSNNPNHISIIFLVSDKKQIDSDGSIRICELLNIPYQIEYTTSINSIDVTDFKIHNVTPEVHFTKAKIAVIIASYNYGNFLIEAVESVLRQTRKPDEIWISDDFSTDNTEEIAKSYVKRFSGYIKYNRNEENLGIVEHFNKAVSLTSSDYICFLGADNRFRSDYIEKTAAILDADDNIGVAYTDFSLFGPRAKMVYANFDEKWRGKIKEEIHYIINFPDYDDTSKSLLNEGKNFIHGSSMYRREAFDHIGGYVEKSEVPEDYNFFLRMTNNGWAAKRVGEPLLEYRQHSTEQANHRMISMAELSYYKNINQTLKQTIGEKDKYIKWLEEVVSEKEKGIQWFNSQLSEKDQGIEWLHTQLNEKSEGIEFLDRQNREKDERINMLTSQLSDLREQLDQMSKKRRELEQENDLLKKTFINKLTYFMRKRGK
ncbi:hypothetical protein BK126_21445 [Paenibacillus sp. FSL H7-0326]|uniref:glycosyltransferase n=1 Tax=Paenibacillus sp. FSL H7-0326 TaxID=1921144 RepID=UPI00096EA4A4|nr:glycosyltransferase [Paenibacillus sp. FSL H7-0326]OMC66563.1 hypothetical protein BK126_21445 [Paenibacillus sp. FSL H7-0326]